VKQNKIPEGRIQNTTWYLAYVPCKHNSIYHCNTDFSLCTKYLLSKISVARKSRPPYIFVRLFPNKKPLSYILAYTVLWSSQLSGTAKYYVDFEWRVRKRTVFSTLTGLKSARFTSLANLHHFLIYILSFSFQHSLAALFTFIFILWKYIFLFTSFFFICAHFLGSQTRS
jgi:hypothetical protein